jgi:ribose 5-phosphate isomerase B
MKHIYIGCDILAYDLKQEIIKFLTQNDIAYTDMGEFSKDSNEMYPVVAQRVCDEIIKSGYTAEGILLCGTGIGMAISANKFPGIYAAVCHDPYSAERARLSNNANVITMGARIVGTELAKKILKEWLSQEFVPGSSTPKVEKIKEFEHQNFKQLA